jgi:hypothetical protein
MATPQQATIADDIHHKLNGEFQRVHGFLSPTSAKFTRYMDDLNTLGKVDAASRSVLLVLLYTLCGDREQCEYYLNNAVRIHAPEGFVKSARVTMLMNLGYFSESLAEVATFDVVRHGLPDRLMAVPPCNGAFHTHKSLFEEAQRMNISNLPLMPDGVDAAAEIMDQWGDTDEEFAAALDFAGEIMRERNLIFEDNLVVEPVPFPPDGGVGYVKLRFKVAVDLDTSIDMTFDYNDRLARSGRKIPSSLVFEFESTRH